MRHPIWLGLLCSLLLLSQVEASGSDELHLDSISVRGGFDIPEVNIFRFNFNNADSTAVNFQQYDVYTVFDLPWGWHVPYLYCGAPAERDCPSSIEDGWEIRFLANGSAGLLTGGGSHGFIGTAGPGIAIRRPSWGFGVDLGGGWAVVSDTTYGSQDLGGAIQFIGHLGVRVDIWKDLFGGFRFHHMSDAGVYGADNLGIDMYLFELGYTFHSPSSP